jgi:hypothetical protein
MAGPSEFMVNPQTQPIGPPNMAEALYRMISGIPAQYQAGAEGAFKRGQYARTEELQKPILGPDGQPATDLPTIQRELLRKYGAEGAKELFPYLSGQEADRTLGAGPPGYRVGGGGPEADAGTPDRPVDSPHGVDPNIMHAAAGEPPREGTAPEGGAGETTTHQNPFQLAVNAGLDPNSPEVKQAFGPFLNREFTSDSQRNAAALKIAGLQRLASGAYGSADASPTGATAQAPPRPMQQPQLGTPQGTEADARAFEAEAKARADWLATHARNASPGAVKGAQDQIAQLYSRAKSIRDALTEQAKPTTAQKEAPPGMSVQEAAAHKKALEDAAASKQKNVATYIEKIGPAREAMHVIDEMDNALTHGWNHISTGPGAKQFLEAKKAVNNIFPGTFSNVTEAETLDKLNSQLAAAAAKSLTARPSQQEFKAFMATNPGLLTARETSKALLDIMRQAKQQDLELGQMADRFVPGPGKNWSDIEEQYQRSHPIISPFTHKPIDAKQAPNGKWYRPDPDRRGKFLEEQ